MPVASSYIRASLKTERDFFLSAVISEISGKYSPADYVPKFRDSQNRFLEIPINKTLVYDS